MMDLGQTKALRILSFPTLKNRTAAASSQETQLKQQTKRD